ncbi:MULTISPECIES: hypothetical protein [unclassified Streptomyces]|uniref:1,4-alpha-glucan branching protein n=1 Tax=Streptomyces evansiae TaxID=3075535 RepID=A0ABD5E8T3_9ACTN|nr:MULTISPECIES: hypothetical protein [unclassified Streptomyces]ASY32135.1 1,4-alpha-glucan branching protein [Streptomyces sp. CLI2509]EFL03379.1 1,4-alpha-glucan branching enzyme [Streptomyces sp. SPB78]EGJ73923.1 hypothetical protein STTU_1134 [Streptomyces sp. Tu6071]MDT0411360.1 1,4-alpha-glucan branching protein [Streptomyces sp. DSM 41979]MDT0416670.1 1,4-alpha-glucan branching protein [Streptomyces sp. DSM 41982]
MAEIHRTTLTPSKLELLAVWLPKQPWYQGGGGPAELEKAGGFRLDDPAGEVGIEFMAVTDRAGAEVVTYHVPLTYRGAPVDGLEAALVGTSEHGVLGKRWVYDGAHDAVLCAQLLALARGTAEAQAQSLSDTPDPSVHGRWDGPLPEGEARPSGVVSGPEGTSTTLCEGRLLLRTHRVLRAADAEFPPGLVGYVSGLAPADLSARSLYASFHLPTS